MAEWKDISSYSKSDKEHKPNCWQVRLGRFKVTITNNHRDYPGVYVMHLDPGLLDTQPLVARDREQAQNEALDIFQSILNDALGKL